MQTFDVSAGQAHVFYPEADQARCTAALLLEVDPIGLVRGRQSAGALAHADQAAVCASLLARADYAAWRGAIPFEMPCRL